MSELLWVSVISSTAAIGSAVLAGLVAYANNKHLAAATHDRETSRAAAEAKRQRALEEDSRTQRQVREVVELLSQVMACANRIGDKATSLANADALEYIKSEQPKLWTLVDETLPLVHLLDDDELRMAAIQAFHRYGGHPQRLAEAIATQAPLPDQDQLRRARDDFFARARQVLRTSGQLVADATAATRRL
jgi:hypothetical protein